MSSEFLPEQCVICHQNTGANVQSVSEEGMKALIDASEARGLFDLHQYLLSSPPVVQVHKDCRKYFTDLRKIKRQKSEEVPTPSRALRSAGSLDWKHVCFLCGNRADKCDADVHFVRTLEIRDSLLQCCTDRADEWGLEVRGRLESCNDLVAEEALYHHLCYNRFTRNRSKVADCKQTGRRADPDMTEAFEYLCDLLESNCENTLYSLEELRSHMFTVSSTVYSNKQLNRKLLEKYGSHIVFSEVSGRPDVICFRDMCSYFM